jgi:Tol biopolymer transport system component
VNRESKRFSRLVCSVVAPVIALLLCANGSSTAARLVSGAPSSPPAAAGRIAFIRDGDVWVHDLATGEESQLTGDGDDSGPRWSPDGNRLAYFRSGNKLWIVAVDGSSVNAVDSLGTVAYFSWSPAMDTLAYIDSAGNLVVEDADGSGQQTLAGPPAPAGAHFDGVQDLAWSPDGAWIAFDRFDPATEQDVIPSMSLWRVRPDGTDEAEVFDVGSFAPRIKLWGWSADGSRIIYWPTPPSASLSADQVGLAIVDAAGGTPQQLVDAMLGYPDFVAEDPSDSGRLAVVEGAGREDWTGKSLHLIDSATGADTALTGSDVTVSSPAWSPDGRYLAYVSMPDSGPVGGNAALAALMQRRLVVIDVSGQSPPIQLTDDPDYRDESPRWTADGSGIVFARIDTANSVSLWLAPISGAAPTELVGDLSPSPLGEPVSGLAPSDDIFGFYGHLVGDRLFDLWTPSPAAKSGASR